MLRIGITGGIGSGKSRVCQYFEKMGVPVYYADDIANLLINSDPVIRKEIIASFGPSSYTKKGLNKAYIREKVFNDEEALTRLNLITHPVVFRHFEAWCAEMEKQGHPFIIKEAALIFETDSFKHLHFFVCVIAPLETRIARVMHRDGLSRKELIGIIKKQLPDEEKIKRSDIVINNPDDELLLPQLVALHQLILKKVNHGK